ncbi:MAG: hypothetical protein R3F43_25365 [bacterium]
MLAGLVFALGVPGSGEAARAQVCAGAPVTAPASSPVVVPGSVASAPHPPCDWPALKAAEALCADCRLTRWRAGRRRPWAKLSGCAPSAAALRPPRRAVARGQPAAGAAGEGWSTSSPGAPQYRRRSTPSAMSSAAAYVLTSAWADGTELSRCR